MGDTYEFGNQNAVKTIRYDVHFEINFDAILEVI